MDNPITNTPAGAVPIPDTLPRYLAAAWIAYYMGVTPATAQKNYLRGEVGEFWIELAALVRAAMARVKVAQ